jgi:hypothetical protein
MKNPAAWAGFFIRIICITPWAARKATQKKLGSHDGGCGCDAKDANARRRHAAIHGE